MIDYEFSWKIQDGKLSYDTGRIIMYDGLGVKSNGPSRDHNDLIASFASKYRIPKSEVMSNGYRFYWRPLERGKINISPVRRIDEDWFCNHLKEFNYILDDLFKRGR